MSMPVATYGCSACKFSRWDSIMWGYRYYLLGDTRIPMQVALGWCHTCADLTALEVLPTAQGEGELEEGLRMLQAALRDLIAARPPSKRWWPFQARKSLEQSNLEDEIESAEQRLAEYQLRRAALSSRTSPARCLTCASDECVPLPPHEVDYFDMASAPTPTGFTHPGCDGELLALCDGTRLSLRLTEKAYDPEGRLLAATPAHAP
jgi:hypothetical protein